VIVGDSNMSETTTLLKVGSTDLVLRMVEAGVACATWPGEPDPGHPRDQPRPDRAAQGQAGQRAEASALEIQDEYLTRVRDFVDREGPTTR
jgi:proteasome accessory factor A